MSARLLVAALIAAAIPQVVLARPAVIRVFEAAAREAPSPDAKVLHVFPEHARVSVDETAQDGWRKVRLPDGAVAWLEDSALTFPEPGSAEAVPADRAVEALGAAEPTITETGTKPKIFVKDLAHIADLTSRDPVVYPMAERLEDRRRAAITAGVIGLGASVVLVAIGINQMHDGFDDFGQTGNTDLDGGYRSIIGGVTVAGLTPLLMWAILPKRSDLLDVLNTWNTRHPDEPFELDAGGLGHRHRNRHADDPSHHHW